MGVGSLPLLWTRFEKLGGLGSCSEAKFFSCAPWKQVLMLLTVAEPPDKVERLKCHSLRSYQERSQHGYFHHWFCFAWDSEAKQERAEPPERGSSP